MNSDTFITLLHNAALLLALAVLYDTVPRPETKRRWDMEILSGVLIGLIGMIIMLTPWRFSSGIIIDTRSILISMASLFTGVIPTLIVVGMTVFLRVIQGGNGVFTGILVISVSASLGLAWRYLLHKTQQTPRWYSFYGFGLIVHIAMLLCMFTLPPAIASQVLQTITLPVLAIYPIGTILLGLLLTRQQQRNTWQQSLRQERDLLARISETSNDAILIADRDYNIFSANPAACRMFGHTEQELIQLKGDNLVDLTDQRIPLAIEANTQTGRFIGEIRFVRKNKEIFTGEAASAVFKDSQGQDRISIIIRDISDRKKAENQLRTILSRQESILAAIPDILMEVDSHKVYTWANDVGQEFFGQEVIGREAAFYFYGEQDTYDIVQPLFQGSEDSIYVESWQRRQDGEKRLLAWWCRVLKDDHGNVIGALSSARDITEIILLSEQLRQRVAQLEVLHQYSIEISGLVSTQEIAHKIIDLLYKILSWDHAALRLYNPKTGEVELMAFHRPDSKSDELSDTYNRLKEAIRLPGQGLSGWVIQYGKTVRCADVSQDPRYLPTFPHIRSGLYVSIKTGKETIGCLNVESTQLNQFSREDERLLDTIALQAGIAFEKARLFSETNQLSSDLAEQVETLQHTRARLLQSEKLAAIGELVAGIAHELNNPLASLILNTQMLQIYEAEDGNTSDRVTKGLETILRDAKRASKIVRGLLEFSRQRHSERHPTEINPVVQGALDLLNYELRAHNIHCQTNLASGLPLVNADPFQLQQAVINIINNSWQAMESQKDRRIEIWTETGSPEDPLQKTSRPVVRLKICDNGPGIPASSLSRIFDPFYSTKEPGKGTGLGLSICHGIISEHGGNIWAASEEGQGAIFTIELPIDESLDPISSTEIARSENPRTPPAPENAAEHIQHILVVDHETSILRAIRKILAQRNYQVTACDSARSALQALGQEQFDAIIADINLPEMDGMDFYQVIKLRYPQLTSNIIFTTGGSVNAVTHQFLEKNRLDFLSKPFEITELHQIIEKHLMMK